MVNKWHLQIIFLLFLGMLLSACLAPPAPPATQVPNTETPQPSATAVPILTNTAQVLDSSAPPSSQVSPPLQPTPAKTVGGGKISTGFFTFDLRIYRDPGLNKNPAASSLYSDVEGFGEYMTWVYKGAPLNGPVYEFWGVQPHVNQLNSFPSLKNGDNGGRSGGIFLPGGPFLPGTTKPGDSIKLVLRLETPKGNFGAVLTFTLKKGSNGLEPANITVRVLGAD